MYSKTLLLLSVLCSVAGTGQNAAMPLESVVTQGTAIPQAIILEISGLRPSAPVDKAAMDRACQKLQETGLFISVTYRCTPTKKGYALELSLEDQAPLAASSIDVPGVPEDEAWQWLSTKFKRFNRQIPQSDEGQRFLARELERYLGPKTRGQPLAIRMETDIRTKRVLLSFQPETLPKVHSFAFTGNQVASTAELEAALKPVAANAEYTERKFAGFVDLNLRPVYEHHGLYRVQFEPSGPQWGDGGVSITVGIQEGLPYALGKVDLVGEELPLDRMMAAAKLPIGKLADWKLIQQGIWEMERVVKRTGYFEATAASDRAFDDRAHILNLAVQFRKGPLYRYGALRISGLSPTLESRARSLWKPKEGDPYDYSYPHDFLREFSRAVDFRNFRKYDAKALAGEGKHVMDIVLTFETR